jgi:Protein of unknown function (DUF2889)
VSKLHERTLTIETRPISAQRLAVHAELRDVRHVDMPAYLGVSHPAGVVHHMMLDLELDAALIIVDAHARMETAPFSPSEKTRGEGCRDILPSYRQLVGTRLDAGYAAQVFEMVGGRLGCFHILSLAQCVPFAVRTATSRLCGGALRMPRGSRNEVRDSCAEWRDASPHWTAVREAQGAGFAEFRREMRVTARVGEDLRLGMTAELADRGPAAAAVQASLTFWLQVPGFTILESAATVAGGPFAGCPATAAGAPGLRGLSVTKGFTAAALERIGAAAGCAHLTALVVALTPVIPQASGALAGFLKLSPEQKLRNRASNPQVDSCHMWRSDGPLVGLERSPKRGEPV